MMKPTTLKCSLCCEKTFETKIAFIEHISLVLANITCPICNNKWSSLAHLLEHLNLDNCQPDFKTSSNQTTDTENVVPEDCNDAHEIEVKTVDSFHELIDVKSEKDVNNLKSDPLTLPNSIPEALNENNLVSNGMYLQIVNKDKENDQDGDKQLALVTGNGEMQQFVIMTTENTEMNLQNLITKQNSDGTISLEAIAKDITLETEAETVIARSEKEAEYNQPEMYSCNTCGVSFSSVFDHIQTYHTDQEVVLEERLDTENGTSILEGEALGVKGTTKKIITDTGDIVDATVIEMPVVTEPTQSTEEEKSVQQKNQAQVNKLMISDIAKTVNQEEFGGPFHKVVLKNVLVNGERLKTYFCLSCNIYVSDLDQFKSQPCKNLKYSCAQCPVAYESAKSLCAHMKVHKTRTTEAILPPPAEFFECEICNTFFSTNKSLKLHKRMHDPIKTRPLVPPLETYDGNEGSTDSYICTVCDKVIPIDYQTLHENSHKAEEQMNCGICNKKFQSKEYLEMHMSVHNIGKVPANKTDKSLPYSCVYCDRRFTRPHEKVKHERIHTGEKPHSCEICGKSFRVAYCLTLHMRTHTGARPYGCLICGKRFKAHSVFNHHMLTHSEIRRYKCPYCPKAFKTSVQLAGHKNSHTKPFSCQHCNRPFASLYAVRVHTETHARQNNLKFSCHLCGATYARAFALKDHVKQAHEQDIETSTLNMPNLTKDQEDWTDAKEVADTEVELQSIDVKVLPNGMNELEMATNQL